MQLKKLHINYFEQSLARRKNSTNISYYYLIIFNIIILLNFQCLFNPPVMLRLQPCFLHFPTSYTSWENSVVEKEKKMCALYLRKKNPYF